MTAVTTPRERRTVTLVHTVKKRLRDALKPTTTTNTQSSFATDETSISPSPHQLAALPFSRSAARGNGQGDPNNNQASSSTAEDAGTSRLTPRRPCPSALPTRDFYRRFPRAIGPLANVVVTSAEDYQLLLLTAKRIAVVTSKKERKVEKGRLLEADVRKGGFFVYQPENACPQYFQLYKCAADVYGSASYLKA